MKELVPHRKYQKTPRRGKTDIVILQTSLFKSEKRIRTQSFLVHGKIRLSDIVTVICISLFYIAFFFLKCLYFRRELMCLICVTLGILAVNFHQKWMQFSHDQFP